MKAGDIIYFNDLKFNDGGHADKLVIVLAATDDKVLFAICTSKGKEFNVGCQPKRQMFFIKAGTTFFTKGTWVDLRREPSLTDKDNLQRLLRSGRVVQKGTLPEQKKNELLNCLKKHCIDALSREMCEMLGIKPKYQPGPSHEGLFYCLPTGGLFPSAP